MSQNLRRAVLAVAALVVLIAGIAVFRTTRSPEPAPGGLAPLGLPPDTTQAAGARAQPRVVDKPVLQDTTEDAMSPSLITKAQAKLKEEGHYAGAVDGTWSRDLNRAIKAYQHERGLRVTGILDAYTRAALGI